jgi:hypothetical protein
VLLSRGGIRFFPAFLHFFNGLSLLLFGSLRFNGNIITLDGSIGLCVINQGRFFLLLDLSLLLLKLSLLLLHLPLLRNLLQQLIRSSNVWHFLVLFLSGVFRRNN